MEMFVFETEIVENKAKFEKDIHVRRQHREGGGLPLSSVHPAVKIYNPPDTTMLQTADLL